MNEITIHGNLTDEPTLHHMAVLTFSVAVNGRRFDRATSRWADTPRCFTAWSPSRAWPTTPPSA
jgi:single-stranded DNA-binding protein